MSSKASHAVNLAHVCSEKIPFEREFSAQTRRIASGKAVSERMKKYRAERRKAMARVE
jgi:hypothetical protein